MIRAETMETQEITLIIQTKMKPTIIREGGKLNLTIIREEEKLNLIMEMMSQLVILQNVILVKLVLPSV